MNIRIRALRTLGTRIVDDRGFGVIEVVVAMFLLAVVAVAIIPILIAGLRLSVQNAVIASATQLANQQVEQVRGATACNAVVASTITTTSQGVPLKAVRTIGTTCPATGYPTTVKVSVSVTRTDTSAVLATANTLVFVTGP